MLKQFSLIIETGSFCHKASNVNTKVYIIQITKINQKSNILNVSSSLSRSFFEAETSNWVEE
jgi:hypothetical protein